MSFFDRQGISEALVRKRAESGNGHGSQEERDEHNGREEEEDNEDDASKCSKDDRFEDDVQTLRDYSFLSVGTDRTFEMNACAGATGYAKMVGGQQKARAVEAVLHQEPFRRIPDRRARELDILPSTFSPCEIGNHTTIKGGGFIERMGFTAISCGMVRVEEREYNWGYRPVRNGDESEEENIWSRARGDFEQYGHSRSSI
jgi:hypothetical protein